MSTHKSFNFEVVVFVAVIIGTILFIREGSCRAIYVPGTATETEVTHFEFIERLINPCGIEKLEKVTLTNSATTINATTRSRNELYESMIMAADNGLRKLDLLMQANPNLPECNGINLESLPAPISLNNITEEEILKEMYESSVFLAAHFHIMGLDRQLSFVGVNDVRDQDLDEDDDMPAWRLLKCNNESDSFFPRLEDMTLQMENILCTLVSSANSDERASFRGPFNRLTSTKILRYHSSCSTLQIRDCIVLRQANHTLTIMSTKFNALLARSDLNQINNDHYNSVNSNDV